LTSLICRLYERKNFQLFILYPKRKLFIEIKVENNLDQYQIFSEYKLSHNPTKTRFTLTIWAAIAPGSGCPVLYVHPWDGCEVEQVPMEMEATAVSLFIGIFLWVYALSGLFVYALFVTTVILTKKLRENPYFVLSLTLSACDIQFLIITVFVWDELISKHFFFTIWVFAFLNLPIFLHQ
jgi:hypothetical protein